MLSAVLAHTGQPPAPHDLWGAWHLDPLLLVTLVGLAWAYRRGHLAGRRRSVDRARARCFAAALATLAVALVSPLDALSSALASAHMVQHVLLVLVAAPLLALSAPGTTVVRGSPAVLRRATARWRSALHLSHADLRPLRTPASVWLLHAGALWLWHASGPYGWALEHEAVHILEHATFLLTGLAFWGVVVGGRAAGRVPHGLGILLVFTMALQSVLLSALLTFAGSAWYEGYATTTAAWGLEPLADQQLAGAIMWIPAGLVYVGAGLALLVSWLHASERADGPASTGPVVARLG